MNTANVQLLCGYNIYDGNVIIQDIVSYDDLLSIRW